MLRSHLFIQPIVLLGSYLSKQDREVDGVGMIRFSTALGSQRSLNCYNQSRSSDTLSRRTQTIWNAQYPLWSGHHVRGQVGLEVVVTRRTVVIGRSWPRTRDFKGRLRKPDGMRHKRTQETPSQTLMHGCKSLYDRLLLDRKSAVSGISRVHW